MPPKMFVCSICQKIISKRKSIIINGHRICRIHKEAIEYIKSVKKLDTQLSKDIKFQNMKRDLKISSAVSWIQSRYTYYGIPLDVSLFELKHIHKSDVIRDIRNKIEKDGMVLDINNNIDNALYKFQLLCSK